MKKKILSCLMAAMIFVSAIPSTIFAFEDTSLDTQKTEETKADHLPQSDGNNLRLWYTNPGSAATWTNTGLVIGNGKTGGILFGEVGKEQIHFNEKTLWNGGPSDTRPDYNGGNRKIAATQEQINTIRKQADTHTNSVFPLGTGGLTNLMGDGDGMGSYQDFGDLYLDFSEMGMTNSNVTNYVRDLDMRTAISSVHFDYKGVHYEREYFASHPDGVMVIHLTASEKEKLTFTASTKAAFGLNTEVTAADGRITLTGEVIDNQMYCEMQAQILPTNGTIRTNGDGTITVNNADEATIVLTTGTDYANDYPTYRGENPHEQITMTMDNAVQKSYSELKEAHLADYQELFSRVEFDLDAACPELPTNELMKKYRQGEYDLAVEEMIYQFGRYLTIAGSREGDPLPTNLCGIWLIGSANSYWGADFHFNVNVQMNYWPALSTNLAECETVFNDYMESLVEPGRVSAGQSCALPTKVNTPTGEGNGFLVHTQNNPFGCTATFGSQEYGWNIGGSSWALQNVYDYYLYTGDVEYLEEKIYPMLKEMANFWDQFLWYSEYQDRLIVGPSVSAEQGPTVNGTTYDQSIVWELYKMAIEASEILDVDAKKREVWKEKQSQLNPILIGEEGQVKEWYEETTLGKAQAGNLAEVSIPNFGAGGSANQGSVHRHTSQLIGLYPGTLINKDTKEWMNAAIKSLEQRGLNGTGWSKAMKINMYARTGLAEDTYKMVRAMCAGNENGILDNLLDSHPPFQIDGNYGLTAGMTEMLLQSQLGYVQFLPALPNAWENGAVEGIKARGNFTISESWKHGLADQFTVCYEGTETSAEFIGEYEGIADAKVYADGKEIDVVRDDTNHKIRFDAKQGIIYTIDVSTIKSTKVIEAAEMFMEHIPDALENAANELRNSLNSRDDNLRIVYEKIRMMCQLYEAYELARNNIYYITIQDGYTLEEIDEIYYTFSKLKDTLIENKESYEYYRFGTEEIKNMLTEVNDIADTRKITFSRESGVVTSETFELSLNTTVSDENTNIRYTLDGTDPSAESEIYNGKMKLSMKNGNIVVKAAIFLEKQRISSVYSSDYIAPITFTDVTAAVDDWGTEYLPGKMIDGNTATRWASKAPTGDIEILLSFDKDTSVDHLIFDQFVSYRNGTDKFLIYAYDGEKYEPIYEGVNLGDESDAVNADHAIKKISFDKVVTSAMKIVIQEGYLGEPSFYEITPGLEKEEIIVPANTDKLEEILALSDAVDRDSIHYKHADHALKNAFETAILEAKDCDNFTQAQADSIEYFLRSRYDRFEFGTTVFEDVSKDAYYYEPVKWAVKNQITSGLKPTIFGPEMDCTRGQVVTFLWRNAGQPEPKIKETTFKDVPENAYYYKAVLWAVENNITSGYNAETFGSKDQVTRCQFVTFLWRQNLRPQPAIMESKFTDVSKHAYYYEAVLWSVEHGITAGYYENQFAPDLSCTRSQVVSFLYRYSK